MIAFDFFCGGGGVSKGLENAGIDVIAGFDVVEEYRQTYDANHNSRFMCEDVRDVTCKRLKEIYPNLLRNRKSLLLAGCAPCQPFSNQRRCNYEHEDRTLLDAFGRIVDEVKPGYVFLENVPGIVTKGGEVYERFIDMLRRNHYYYWAGVVNAKDYGVPQNRKRFILIASLFNDREGEMHAPRTTHGEGDGLIPYVTVRDAIGAYPPILAGETHPTVPNHHAASMAEITLQRIRNTPEGGDRRNWPRELWLDCHSGEYTGHMDVYGRMRWDQVAPTLTARCTSISNGRFGHPEQNRALSQREAAKLQSFEDDYIFYGTHVSISRQIGNAVPVLLAERIGEYIMKLNKKAKGRKNPRHRK